VLAGGRQKEHDGNASREILVPSGSDIAVATIESAREVSKKTRTLIAGERDPEESRDLRTNRIDGALYLVDDLQANLHVERTTRLLINPISVLIDLSG
jgi:hypothetical protein